MVFDILYFARKKTPAGWLPRKLAFTLSVRHEAPDEAVFSTASVTRPPLSEVTSSGVDAYALLQREAAAIDRAAVGLREVARADDAGVLGKVPTEIMQLAVVLHVANHCIQWPAAWNKSLLPEPPALELVVPGEWLWRAAVLRFTLLLQHILFKKDVQMFDICAKAGLFEPDQVAFVRRQLEPQLFTALGGGGLFGAGDAPRSPPSGRTAVFTAEQQAAAAEREQQAAADRDTVRTECFPPAHRLDVCVYVRLGRAAAARGGAGRGVMGGCPPVRSALNMTRPHATYRSFPRASLPTISISQNPFFWLWRYFATYSTENAAFLQTVQQLPSTIVRASTNRYDSADEAFLPSLSALSAANTLNTAKSAPHKVQLLHKVLKGAGCRKVMFYTVMGEGQLDSREEFEIRESGGRAQFCCTVLLVT